MSQTHQRSKDDGSSSITALNGCLCTALAAIWFQLDACGTSFWAVRPSGQTSWLLGQYTAFYCLTCDLEEQTLSVRLWDAVLLEYRDLRPPKRHVTKTIGYACVRTTLAALVQAAGWQLESERSQHTGNPRSTSPNGAVRDAANQMVGSFEAVDNVLPKLRHASIRQNFAILALAEEFPLRGDLW